jgi:hypothetical protein
LEARATIQPDAARPTQAIPSEARLTIQPNAATVTVMHVAFVLVRESVTPGAEELEAAYAAMWPQATPFLVETGDEDEDGATVISLIGPDGQAHVAPMAMPVPGGEAEDAARFSLAFLGQEPDVPSHGAHLIVAYFPADELSLVDELKAFTRLLATVLAVTEGDSLYWGNASATHPADFFLQIAAGDELPIALWSGVSLASTADGRHSFLSLGMSQLMLPDLLLTAPLEEANEGLQFFLQTLNETVVEGEAPDDGSAAGRTPGERLLVRHEPNPLDATQTVFVIDLP